MGVGPEASFLWLYFKPSSFGQNPHCKNPPLNLCLSVIFWQRMEFLHLLTDTFLLKWVFRGLPSWCCNFLDGGCRSAESVKCRFSKCRLSVLNLKFDFISDGGCTREKQIQKALGSLPPCGNRCRFSESAICSSRVHPPSEIKSNFKFKALRWRPLRWRLTLSEKSGFVEGFQRSR